MTQSIGDRPGPFLQPERIGGFREYRQGTTLERRGASTADEDEALRKAVDRLRRFLESGQPFRDDVPKGTYLNITL
jgi:hypothetical protein